MNNSKISNFIREIIQNAPSLWLAEACKMLRSTASDAPVKMIIANLPVTNNSNLAHSFMKAVETAEGYMSWEALGCSIEFACETLRASEAEKLTELLWSGPPPGEKLSARRIDQVLYDLIQKANREVLLVTFAAAKIDRLADVLRQAIARGVTVRLILEFEETSEGGLSYDAIRAFPADLVATSTVFYWPTEMRERNRSGRPGKLHAKVAQVDDCVIVSSANLTDDAFTRNLEMGLLIGNVKVAERVKEFFESLISKGTLQRLKQ